MILEIDAGNTFIKWRALGEERVVDGGRFLTRELSSQKMPKIWQQCKSVRIASVAGVTINTQLTELLQPLPVAFARTQFSQSGLNNSYADPSRMGVDRWLAMLAAFHRCDAECCVVDCGSAITVDYVARNGQHLGGFILPGLRLMNNSLQVNTAEVIVDQSIECFSQELGTSTSEAVQHGVNYMFSALVEKVVADVSQRSGCELFITGGDGPLFSQLAGCGHLIEDLVMDGLVWSLDTP